MNSVVFTGKVPGDGGTLFFSARFPASASMGTIIRKRPASMVKPRVMLYQWVFALIPANAEPLLPGGRGERVENLGSARAGPCW